MSKLSVEDRLLIRELYGRYAVASARQDVDAWLAAWSTQGVWKTPHFEAQGHDQIRQCWDGSWASFKNVAPLNEVGEIVATDGGAAATCVVYEIITLAAGGVMKMAGLYQDAFVHEGGAWRFSRRSYEPMSLDQPGA